MTELEAVNLILSSVGESEVNSLVEDTDIYTDLALSALRSVQRTVTAEEWDFNTIRDVEYEPNAQTNLIVLPPDVVSARFANAEQKGDIDPILLGQQVFDSKNNTFEFGVSVKATVVILDRPWLMLPRTVRQYIAARAARVFAFRQNGGAEKYQNATAEEQELYRIMRREHMLSSEVSMRNSSQVRPWLRRNH